MKKLAIAAGLSLFVHLSAPICLAQDTSVTIKSRADMQSPRIVIRSPFDFEKDISLKVRPDPAHTPSDVLIKRISMMEMKDTRGIRITSGFDIDVKNDLVLAYSGGVSQIIKSAPGPSGLSVIASFKDNKNNFISPPKGSLALYTTYGEKLCFDYMDVKSAAPKMAFVLLLDRSGSMGEVIADVRASAQSFLKDLPPSSKCALASFNGQFAYHHQYFQSCNDGDFRLDELEAGGGTQLYAPILDAYESLSRDMFRDYQKAVIVITDGQIEPDEDTKQKLIAAKKDILTFVYFLGEKNEHPLIGLADAFLRATTDLKASLDHYFHSLSNAYGMQKVLIVRPCKGGQNGKTK